MQFLAYWHKPTLKWPAPCHVPWVTGLVHEYKNPGALPRTVYDNIDHFLYFSPTNSCPSNFACHRTFPVNGICAVSFITSWSSSCYLVQRWVLFWSDCDSLSTLALKQYSTTCLAENCLPWKLPKNLHQLELIASQDIFEAQILHNAKKTWRSSSGHVCSKMTILCEDCFNFNF